MASYLFKNIKTGETNVINSKDSKQAHKYENGTWKYVKPVPKQKATKQTKKEVNKDAEVLLGLSKIEAMARRMERCANEYDMKDLLRPMYAEIQNVVSELKSKLK